MRSKNQTEGGARNLVRLTLESPLLMAQSLVATENSGMCPTSD